MTMKRIIIASLAALIAANAGAQTMYDALNFSQNNYYGTARSIGMGNAMTAVGGDLGSIGLNPAGSAVYNYSQVTVTPNLTISSTSASYSPYAVNGSDVFSNAQQKTLTRFSMPNVGFTFNMPTGQRSGLKSVTYGFVCNGTNNFTGQMMAGGLNDKSSYLGSMAVAASGFDTDFLNGWGYYDGSEFVEFSSQQTDYPYNNPDRGWYAPWNVVTNAQSGSISNFGNPSDPSYYERWIAATEGFTNTGERGEDGNYIYNIYQMGALNQAYGRKTTGSKYDAIFNLGLNFSDNFFLGFNLGFTSLRYDFDEYFKEAAADMSDFVIDFEDATTYFSDFRSRYSYSAEGNGVYGKIGFIGIPAPGLRIGAAVQTPTYMTINEIWRNAADISYADSRFDGAATSPEGYYTYKMRTPYRANVGIAYTFWGMGLLSADYEITDYSSMKFKGEDSFDTTFDNVNDDIKDCMGISHIVRLGAEFKPSPEVAIRAGYNFSVLPEYYYQGTSKYTINDKTNSFSIGLGYSSNGSFFADLSARAIMMSDEYISPYEDYLECGSPLILNKRERYDITATIGWRF